MWPCQHDGRCFVISMSKRPAACLRRGQGLRSSLRHDATASARSKATAADTGSSRRTCKRYLQDNIYQLMIHLAIMPPSTPALAAALKELSATTHLIPRMVLAHSNPRTAFVLRMRLCRGLCLGASIAAAKVKARLNADGCQLEFWLQRTNSSRRVVEAAVHPRLQAFCFPAAGSI